MATGLKELFEKLFAGKNRGWKKSSIVLLHLLSKFSPIDRIYKINKSTSKFFYYFFDKTKKRNPLKDDIYELQKFIPDKFGKKFKEELLRYYYNNNFMDFTLTFIDGHVIAYFGKEAFQKLKHGTRKKILKALEVFNFSDRNGRIFYFRADHDVEGMQRNIEKLLNEVSKIIGLDKIKILVFDRGGFSGLLFRKLKCRYKIKFITLAKQTEEIKKQIKKIRKKVNFKRLDGDSNKKYAISTLNVDGINYRALLILNTETDVIHAFITNMTEEELSNEELLCYYSMHWNQEQEHNAFIKIGGDQHAKAMQDVEYEDTTLIKRKNKLRNRLNRIINEIIRYENKEKMLKGKLGYLSSKIRPKSKRTDNKILRKEVKDTKERLKEIKEKLDELSKGKVKAERQIEKIPDEPKKKKYKYGPVDYSLSMVNLASNLNSKLVEIFSNGEKKFQLATLKCILYSMSALVWENKRYINIEFMGIRQEKDVEGVKRLCDYFNARKPELHGKIMRFGVKAEKTLKIRAPKNQLL